MQQKPYWLIRDTGTEASRLGRYFTGWQDDVTSSWSNEKTSVMRFHTKSDAFSFLRTKFKAKDRIYSSRESHIRFVVMRSFLKGRK